MCAEECTEKHNTNNMQNNTHTHHRHKQRELRAVWAEVCGISSKASSFQSCGLIHPSSCIQSEKERERERRTTRRKVSDERGGRDRLVRGYLDKWGHCCSIRHQHSGQHSFDSLTLTHTALNRGRLARLWLLIVFLIHTQSPAKHRTGPRTEREKARPSGGQT